MADPITRRDALVKLGASGVGLFMVDGIIRGQDAAIRIAGQGHVHHDRLPPALVTAAHHGLEV